MFDIFLGKVVTVDQCLLVSSLHTALLGLCTGLTLLVPDNSATDMLTSLMSRHATSLLPALLTQLMSSQVGLLLLSGLMTL